MHIAKLAVRNSTTRRGHVPIWRNGHAFQLARSTAISNIAGPGSAGLRYRPVHAVPEHFRSAACPRPWRHDRPVSQPFTLHFLIGEVKTIGSFHYLFYKLGNVCYFIVCISGAIPLFAFTAVIGWMASIYLFCMYWVIAEVMRWLWYDMYT